MLSMLPGTILILEEDLQLQWILKTFLEGKGFSIITLDALEEVQAVISKQRVPVIITTEQWLKNSHLLETIRQIKRSLPDIYILMTTYRMMEEKDYEEFFLSGVDDILEKPFALNNITVLLKKRLKIGLEGTKEGPSLSNEMGLVT
ncbi:MAG: response regulator [Thermodesulfobacteriota bacterium]